jgi:PKD repeat protein
VASVLITTTILPTVVISGNTNICQDSSTVLTASGGGSSYQWSNGKTTPAITVNQVASYTVTVTDGNGCSNTRTVQTSMETKPTASFTFVANNLKVTFTNNSVGGTSVLWNFGNGVTTTDNHPTMTYAAAGTYIVTLTVTNNCGSKSYQQTVVTRTATKDLENALQLSIYPNPNDGQFTIVFKNVVSALDIEIQNILGQTIWNQKVSAGTKQVDIQLPNHSGSVYQKKISVKTATF